jgi:DNA polymerase-3 subunit alpha
VVIGDRPLDELVPLYRAPGTEDMPATQFNMKWVEQAGLVKFDFLGLKTLTQIDNAVNLIRKTRDLHVAADGTRLYDPAQGTENDILGIPLDDARTYELYARARVAAVFQVESSA